MRLLRLIRNRRAIQSERVQMDYWLKVCNETFSQALADYHSGKDITVAKLRHSQATGQFYQHQSKLLELTK